MPDETEEFKIEHVRETLPKEAPLPYSFCYEGGEQFQAYVKPATIDDMIRHARQGLERGREVAGILVGEPRVDPEHNVKYVEIVDILPAQTGRASGVDVEIPYDEWHRLTQRVQEEPKWRGKWGVVGWYHSHPTFSAFMSPTDRQTQSAYFYRDWQVAIVISSTKRELKCFHGRDSQTCDLYKWPEPQDGALVPAESLLAKIPVAGPKVAPLPQPVPEAKKRAELSLPVRALAVAGIVIILTAFWGGFLGAGAGAVISFGPQRSPTPTPMLPQSAAAPTLPPLPTPSPTVAPMQTPAPTAIPTPVPTPRPVIYVVQPGDTMARIASLHGVSIESLVKANPHIAWMERETWGFSSELGRYRIILIYPGERQVIPPASP